MPNHSFKLNMLLLAASLLAALVMGEAFVRLAGYQPQILIPPFLYDNHPETWWTLRSGFHTTLSTPDGPVTYAINRQGLRAPRDIHASSSLHYLFVLGDSYTFGWGANEEVTYPRVLARRFKAENQPLEVVNLGVPGYGALHSLSRLEEYSQRIGVPQLVVYMFCPNDPVDNLTGKKEVVWGIRVDADTSVKYARALLGHAYHHSQLLSLVLDQIYNRFFNPRLKLEQTLVVDPTPLEKRRDWINQQALMDKMIQWTKKNNAHLLVGITDDSAYTTAMSAYLGAQGVPFFSVPNYFQLAGRSQTEVLLPHDGHWNALGHHVVAEGIHRELASREWLIPKSAE